MALLVGRDDLASFTGAGYFGYTVGNANMIGRAAVATGTATSLRTGITVWGANTFVRCGIYEQVGGTGSYTLVREIDVLASSGTPTQNTAISPGLAITTGNNYIMLAAGDVTSTATGGEYQWSRDTTVTNGLTTVSMDYDAFPATLPALVTSGDGEMYWYLDGTIASAEDLSVTATLEVKGSVGTPISNRSLNVAVLDPADYSVIAAPAAQTSAAGVIVRGGLTGVSIGDFVLLAVEDAAETDPLARNRVYRVAVYDANA